MKQKLLWALAALAGGIATPVLAQSPGEGNALKCLPPVIQVADAKAATAQFTVNCAGTDTLVTPVVTFAGEVPAAAQPPYALRMSYTVDTQGTHGRAVGADTAGQRASGEFGLKTGSVAQLPAQLSSITRWDPISSTLSLQEQEGVWRVFAVLNGLPDGELVEAGVASAAVANARTYSRVHFGSDVSRFAPSKDASVEVKAVLGLREGKFEVLIGETVGQEKAAVQKALAHLDKKPKDMTRAWNLAARAQFLGLDDEVRYAEQKVAAHNPQLLDEFQHNVRRIEAFKLP